MKVVLIAPEQLRLPDYMKKEVCEVNGIPYKEVSTLEEVMPELDVLYMTRVQKERFFDEDEFDRVKDCFILDAQKLSAAKPEMRVPHPLPRVNEISVDVDSDPRAAYFRQVENGKFVRMALIYTLLQWAGRDDKQSSLIPEGAVRNQHVCRNPRCISNMEVNVDSIFRPAADHPGEWRCVYCESKSK